MEVIDLEQDIKVFYVAATSFPMGIGGAYKTLQSKLPPGDNRMLYGISWPIDGKIMYKAAAEELQEGEAAKYGLETYIIKKGRYISEIITDWKQDETSVGRCFSQLLAEPDIDACGACVERYLNETDVQCMIRLDDKKAQGQADR